MIVVESGVCGEGCCRNCHCRGWRNAVVTPRPPPREAEGVVTGGCAATPCFTCVTAGCGTAKSDKRLMRFHYGFGNDYYV